MIYAFARWLLATVFRVVWRPDISGTEHIPTSGPLLVASNHRSFIDSFVIPLAVSERRVTFLAKSEYFTGTGLRGRLQRLVFTALGAVPVPRDESVEARAALQTALEVLDRGWACGIYPEGTRSRDGRLYRGRTGIAWLALTSGAPVLPVGLVGTDRVQPVGSRRLRLARVAVRYGPVVRPEDYRGVGAAAAQRRRLTDDLMDRIAALSGQERADTYNERTAEG